jgi:large subunit ribosomal protein L10
MARPEKEEAVKEIVGRFKESEAALLTEYRGLHVGEIKEVRTSLREANAEYKVLKNTLTRIAVREVGLEELVAMLQGPTAIAFIHGDAAAAAKALDEAAKKFPVLTIKGGVLDGKILDAEQAKRLARLEPRDRIGRHSGPELAKRLQLNGSCTLLDLGGGAGTNAVAVFRA